MKKKPPHLSQSRNLWVSFFLSELSELRLGVLGGELAKALGIKYQVVVSRKD